MFSEISERMPQLLDGAWITVQLTVYSAAVGLVIALIFGLMGTSSHAWARRVSRVYVEIFRGLAVLILMYWFFYSLPLLGFRLEPMVAGVAALGLNAGAYGAEVVRGAILAVPKAQYEATIALNFSTAQRLRKVIIPQAWAAMIPPLTNLLIQLLKGTALVSLITIVDLSKVADNWRGNSGDSALAYGVSLVFYFVIAQVFVLFMRWLERRANRKLGRSPGPRRPRLDALTQQRMSTGGI